MNNKTERDRCAVITLWFWAYALGAIGLCAWVLVKGCG